MTNPVFPTLSTGPDSKYYTIELENSGMKTPMDGGYVVSRAKHTRRPRRTYTSGYTDISSVDALQLTDFWDLVKGSSTIFDWTDPVSGTVVAVRFSGEPFNFKYTGVGNTKRWDVSFKVEAA